MKTKTLVSAAVVILSLAVVLASCGGGGGGTNPVPPVDAGSPETSAQIQAARDALDGTGLNLPISGAFVTYVKPLIGSDVAGFFLQSQQGGPALFVAVDPAMLNPAPAPGDKVNLVITDMGTASSLRQATGITEYSRIAQGATVTALVQDVNNVTDLVSSLSSYESELLTTAATITSAFSAAGTSFVAAQIDTAGITGNADMKLRMPSALYTALTASYDLMQGCNVTLIGTPLWRFLAQAQLSAWTAADITVDSCPAPAVVSAGATTSTTVRVSFNRAIAASSITNPATQFTFDNGLTASAALVNGRVVDVTTSGQTPGQSYTVTVAGSVTDALGAGVSASANTAVFAGYDPASQAPLVINEVDYDNVGTDTTEFVEIYNASGGTVDLTGYLLSLVNGVGNVEYLSVDLSSAGTLAAGEYLVVSSSNVTVAAGAKVITFAGLQDQIQNGSPDGIALVHSPSETLVDALSYEGSMTSVLVTGITGSVSLVEGTATIAADNNTSVGSLARCPNGSDSNDANSNWQFTATLTPGEANICP